MASGLTLERSAVVFSESQLPRKPERMLSGSVLVSGMRQYDTISVTPVFS